MKKISTVLLVFAILAVIAGALFFSVTPSGRETWNTWFHAVQKADDRTSYETRKSVEDSCRAMIASYQSDNLTYEQYSNDASETKQEWAAQAKMRANRTALTYNEYILKNSYVWADNIPDDIKTELAIIE